MITYITIGADDIGKAKQFYLSILPSLGYALQESAAGLSFALPVSEGQPDNSVEFYVKAPFNGLPATAGNGTMVAFQANSQQQVRDLYRVALTEGNGTSEGAPGFRPDYSPEFYVCYLRDPQGNKISIYSNNPKESRRDG